MLPTFQSLIESDTPLTVTQSVATLNFMTIPLAGQLVIQAGGISRTGEVSILEVGAPLRILDVARRMIEMPGNDIENVVAGLREGEKLHEELVGFKETLECRVRPQVSHTSRDAISPDRPDKVSWMARMLNTQSTDESAYGTRPSTERV